MDMVTQKREQYMLLELRRDAMMPPAPDRTFYDLDIQLIAASIRDVSLLLCVTACGDCRKEAESLQ